MFYVCCMGIINMHKYIICALISSNAPCRDAMMTNDGWEEAKLSKLCRYEAAAASRPPQCDYNAAMEDRLGLIIGHLASTGVPCPLLHR